MKRLTITYNNQTLFDGEVTELAWTDHPGGVRVEGKTRTPAGGGPAGLIGMLTAASKAKTQQAIEDKRAAYDDDRDEDTA